MDKTPTHQSEAHTLLEILSHLQKIDAEFPLQYFICLLHISLNEGLSVTNLAEETNLALSTVSRIVGALSQYRQNGQPYGLVEIHIPPTERRRKELRLTPKGRTLLQRIYKATASGASA